MRKLLNKPWFVAIMAIGALALVVKVMFFQGDKLALPGFTANPPAAEASTSGPARGTAWNEVNKISISGPIRDPFSIKVKAEVAEKAPVPDQVDKVHVSAIWTQDGHTLVVINDRICEDGDQIGRLKIDSASQEGVWLSHWKGRNFVSIGGSFTLNTPAGKFQRAGSSL